jgi:hypothetical protein
MNETSKPRAKKKVNSYLKYSGMGFQLAGLVLAGYFGGKYIDKWLGLEKPIMTLILILLFFLGFMYKLYVDLILKNE